MKSANISSRNILCIAAVIFCMFGYLSWQVLQLSHEIKIIKGGNVDTTFQQKEAAMLSTFFPQQSSLRPAEGSNQMAVSAAAGSVASSAPSAKMESMFEIGSRTKTDKIYAHRYDLYYERFLTPLRSKPNFKMMEIGFLFGQSFQMWKQYFPLGKIYFLDPNKKDNTYPESRFVGDSGNVEDLKRMMEEKGLKGQLDFIIDDGAHAPPHQLTSFQYLFVHGLKPGGIYIIEDIETSYWYSGNCYGYEMKYGRDHPDAFMTRMKPFVDVVNRKYSLPENRFSSSFGEDVDAWVSGIFFAQNTVIVTKSTEEEKNFRGWGYGNLNNLKPPK